MALSKTQVAKLYIAMFDRAPEKKGLDDWYQAAQDNEWGVADLANTMIAAAQQVVATDPAYASFYPQYVNVDTTDPASVRAIIETVYETLFNKTYQDDPEGIDTWVDNVVIHGQSLGEAIASITIVADQIANGEVEADAQTVAAAQAFENKVEVALYAAEHIPSADIDGDGKYDFQDFQNFIKNVTDDPATVNAAKAMVDEYTPKSVTLTTGQDTVVGSKAADTFTAPILTLTDGDNIDGKEGIDTLNAVIANSKSDGITVSNVEKISIQSLGNNSVDMKNYSGVEEVVSKESTGTLTLNNIGNNIKLGVEGASAQLQANFTASALQGTNDIAEITLTNAAAADVQVNAGFENLTVHVDGNSKLSGLVVPGVSTVVVDGSGDLSVDDNVLGNFANEVYENDGKVTLGNDTVTVLSATNNTKGVVASATGQDAQGNVFAAKTITLNNDGSVLLGSGDDMLDITTSGTNTIRTGAGDDTISITQNAAADTINLDTGAGNDLVQNNNNANATDANDVFNLGDGDDTLRVSDRANQAMTMQGVEHLHIFDGGVGAVDLANADSSLKDVTVETAVGQNATINNIVAGTSVKVINYDANSPVALQTLIADWKVPEANTTVDIQTEVDNGAIIIANVTDLTLDFAERVGATAPEIIDAQDSKKLTINAAKATNLGNIASFNNKTETLKITGQDDVATGALLSNAMKSVEISAEKDLSVGLIVASTSALNSVKLTSNGGTVDYAPIGNANITDLASVEISGAKDVGNGTWGTIDAKKIGSVKVTSTGGSVDVGSIATIATAEIGTIDLNAKKDVTVNGLIGDFDDTLEKLTATSTEGAIIMPGVQMADADGFDVSLEAATAIDINGTLGDANHAAIQNHDGDINTVTLSGSAGADIDFVVVDTGSNGGYYVHSIDASDLKGGLTSTIVNADDMDSVSSSTTVNLGARDATIANGVSFTGQVDSITVNGSGGQDTILLNGTIQSGTLALGAGVDTLDMTGLVAALPTHGAVINLSSASHTVDGSSVSAGKIVEFDGLDDGTDNVVNGYSFTASGIDAIVATTNNDVIFGANTGMQIDADAGDDVIIGGAGADTITGNAGNDVFKYVAQGDSTSSNEDHITDFATGNDKIDFSAIGVDGNTTQDVPTAITAAAGALDGTAGEFGGNAIAIYDDGTNTTVYLDVDGSNAFESANDLVLQLDGATGATAPAVGDFLI